MKNKRKIVIGLILAFGLYINTSGILDIQASHPVNSTHTFTTSEEKGPIGGNH